VQGRGEKRGKGGKKVLEKKDGQKFTAREN